MNCGYVYGLNTLTSHILFNLPILKFFYYKISPFCRYVSASEAIWRIFKFQIQFRSIPVQKLSFHVEGKKPCYFESDNDIEHILEWKDTEDSQLTAWFSLN